MTIFPPGDGNPTEGNAHKRGNPSRPIEHRQENELSDKDNIHLDTINRLNLFLLQHHARYNDNLRPVLVYRACLKDDPQQIDQAMRQQALKNWKALSDFSKGNLRWDQIQDNNVWKSIRAYRQLTAMGINIDHPALENTTELDQMLKNLNWQDLKRVITERVYRKRPIRQQLERAGRPSAWT